MEQITLKQAIQTAVRAEELGMTFYSFMAKKYENDPVAKEMFDILVSDEADHKRQFAQLLKEAPDVEKTLSQADSIFMQSVDISRYFKNMEKPEEAGDITKILEGVLNFEKDSVLFYSHMKEIIGDYPQLEMIVKTEKEHVAKIMSYILNDAKFRGMEDKF